MSCIFRANYPYGLLLSNALFVEKYGWFGESLKELAISFLLNNYPILP